MYEILYVKKEKEQEKKQERGWKIEKEGAGEHVRDLLWSFKWMVDHNIERTVK